MRYQVAHLLKGPLGARETLSLDTGPYTLGEDLVVQSLQGALTLARIHNGLLASGQLVVEIEAECIRCLTPFSLTLTVEVEDLLFLSPASHQPSVLYHITEGGWIDLAPALREYVLLSIPWRPLCRPDCRGLCSQCGQNLNEGSCSCVVEAVDPRLTQLRALLS